MTQERLVSPPQQTINFVAAGFLDHFDTALYGFLAPILAPLFFPQFPHVTSLILTYALLAIGIITRPIGVWLAYKTASRQTLSRDLALAIFGLSLAVGCISLLPTAQSIGLMAPLGLSFLRGCIGLFATWERTLTRFLILQHEAQHTAVKWRSIYEGATMCGIFVASLAGNQAVDRPELWRLFFGGASFLTMAIAIHRLVLGMQQSLCPARLSIWQPISLKQTLWKHKNLLLRLSLFHGFAYATYAIPFLLITAYVPLINNISSKTLSQSTPSLFLIDIAAVFFLGQILKTFQPLRTMRFVVCALTLSSVPLFALLPHSTLFMLSLLRLWIVLLGVVFLIFLPFWEKENTPNTPERYILSGLGKVLGSSLIGRNVPAIFLTAHALWKTTMAPALVMVFLGCACLCALHKQHPGPKH